MTLTTCEMEALVGDLDALGQAELVRRRELTARELVEAAIQRIERLNPPLNAVVTRMYEQALAECANVQVGAPFVGVPFLLKDMAVEYAGARFTEGSRFLRDNISTHDQELVRRYRRAGLVILGKTNTPEFGLMPTCESALFGAAHNPWDLARTTGGSSGGSAAAVASGMVPMAHANDLGGSIRFPASCCGVFGFKPTRARNPLGPEYGDVGSGLAAEHAVTRSVRDSAALLDASSGPDLGDPYCAPPPERPFADEIGAPPGKLRIGLSTRTAEGRAAHADCVAAAREAADLCASLGHEILEIDLPGLNGQVSTAIGTALQGIVAWIVEYWIRKKGRLPEADELEPYTRAYWEAGRSVSAADYLLAMDTLHAFSRGVGRFFTSIDVWLTPTLSEPPLRLGELTSSDEDPWRPARRMQDFVGFPAIVANITGGPAMSVPLYWNPAGLPIGVHFLGRYGDDATLFRLAAQLEEARPWKSRRPEDATILATDTPQRPKEKAFRAPPLRRNE